MEIAGPETHQKADRQQPSRPPSPRGFTIPNTPDEAGLLTCPQLKNLLPTPQVQWIIGFSSDLQQRGLRRNNR